MQQLEGRWGGDWMLAAKSKFASIGGYLIRRLRNATIPFKFAENGGAAELKRLSRSIFGEGVDFKAASPLYFR